MDITAPAQLRRIDIRVRIHPNDRNLSPQALLHRARRPCDGPNGDAVVAAEREHQPSLRRMLVHLLRQLPRHGRNQARVLHPAMRRVRGGEQVLVGVHGVVVVEGEVQVGGERGEEAGFDERAGADVDAGMALRGDGISATGSRVDGEERERAQWGSPGHRKSRQRRRQALRGGKGIGVGLVGSLRYARRKRSRWRRVWTRRARRCLGVSRELRINCN